jgi:hypothetical protein
MANSHSVSVRLQRVTTETVHISVPLTPELWRANLEELGTETINVEKLMQTAIEQGRLPSTVWSLEAEPVITLHPLQTPPDYSARSRSRGEEE